MLYKDIILLILLYLPSLLFPQEKKIEIKELSFGKVWSTDDTSDVVGLGNPYDRLGVVNGRNVFFIQDTILNQNQIDKIINAKELQTAWLSKITTDIFTIGTPFKDTLIAIDKSIIVTGANILQIFLLERIEFNKGFYSGGNNFKGYLNLINNCVFQEFSCRSDSFSSNLIISNSQFQNTTELTGADFNKPLKIFDSKFDSTLNISTCNFKSELTMEDLVIKNFSLKNCSFTFKPKFRRIKLVDTLDLSNTDFEGGVDFRRTNFQEVTTIYLDETFFPIGELNVYWEPLLSKINLKGRKSFISKLFLTDLLNS